MAQSVVSVSPFSAVPESMRPRTSRYNVEVGKTQDSGDDSMFGDLTRQHGMTNTLTFNSGSRIADGYQCADAWRSLWQYAGGHLGQTSLGPMRVFLKAKRRVVGCRN